MSDMHLDDPAFRVLVPPVLLNSIKDMSDEAITAAVRRGRGSVVWQ
jgi:hypothetical protein